MSEQEETPRIFRLFPEEVVIGLCSVVNTGPVSGGEGLWGREGV